MPDKHTISDGALLASGDYDFFEKGWKTLGIQAVPTGPPKTFLEDPFNVVYSQGYKDRRWSPTYRLLKQVVQKVGILSAIINTRITQVSMFSAPYRRTNTLGYAIRHKDRSKNLTKSDINFITALEDFIFNCGRGKKNRYSARRRNGFREFLAKFVRDRLSIDQACFEINPDKNNRPFEFIPIDGATIKIAATGKDFDKLKVMNSMIGVGSQLNLMRLNAQRAYKNLDRPISYVQVINNQIINTYTEDELAFCPYNLDSDINTFGYGVSEIEQIIRVLTGVLNAETYNFNFFHNATVPKGIFVIKNQMNPEMLEAFKREWYSMLRGNENVFRTPVINADNAQWMDLNTNQKDAEFIRWLEYLIRIICAVYLIDPAEINFDISGQIPAQAQYDTQSEWRVKKSKDKGLRPLLKFIADQVNENIIDRIDPNFQLDFLGLDDLSQKERQELIIQQTQSYRTVNEARADEDLPPLEGGDFPLNPAYLQGIQLMMMGPQMQQQEQEKAKKKK